MNLQLFKKMYNSKSNANAETILKAQKVTLA